MRPGNPFNMEPWGPPPPGTEDALYKSRVLNVEEKPFRRLTKRLLTEPSPLYSLSAKERLPTPPPPPPQAAPATAELTAEDEGDENEEDTSIEQPAITDSTTREEKAAVDRRQLREDIILDFTAFDSSLVRTQFLLQSNARERGRYAEEKIKIEEAGQNVRDSTAKLRLQLDDAQKTLAVRKTYDELAEVITRNKTLRPRDEQYVELEKLRGEIEDLERESREHDQAWKERREQFGHVTDEAARLRRLIRDEKEEILVQTEGDELLDVEQTRGRASNLGTPRPEEGGLTPIHHAQSGSGAATPRSRRATPQPEEIGMAESTERSLDIIPGLRVNEDAEMTDEGEVINTAQEAEDRVTESQPSSQGQPSSQAEAVKPELQAADQMDTR